MSEYQYYEFRKIDSSLSDRAMKQVSALSSRAHVSRNSASFTYHYGDFPADPIKVLMRHFDALFYMANWGSRRVAFRFPVSAMDCDAFQRFALGETISIEQKNVHVIVDLWFEDEGLHEWVDGEGTLDRILGLYDDLLVADYRSLFLSWLQAAFLEQGWEPDSAFPPVPPGLRKLSERHRALIDLFDIDSDLVAAAASFSDPIRQASNEELAQAIESMPAEQQIGFLRRMVLGEPASVVAAELRRQLRIGSRFPEASVAAPLASPASTGALFAKARRMQSDRKRKASEREAALKLRRLEALERDEESLWRRVDELIAGKTVTAYDEAIGILKDLSDLALHKERREEFMRRVQTILGKYPRLSGLQSRIRYAKLIEGLESK
jgi:hypothetical protein